MCNQSSSYLVGLWHHDYLVPALLSTTGSNSVLQAAQITLFRHINSIINALPVPHQVSECT